MAPRVPVQTVAVTDPSTGARTREILLLIGYAFVMIAGVWTVAASELGADEPPSAHADTVEALTQRAK